MNTFLIFTLSILLFYLVKTLCEYIIYKLKQNLFNENFLAWILPIVWLKE